MKGILLSLRVSTPASTGPSVSHSRSRPYSESESVPSQSHGCRGDDGPGVSTTVSVGPTAGSRGSLGSWVSKTSCRWSVTWTGNPSATNGTPSLITRPLPLPPEGLGVLKYQPFSGLVCTCVLGRPVGPPSLGPRFVYLSCHIPHYHPTLEGPHPLDRDRICPTSQVHSPVVLGNSPPGERGGTK